MWRPRVSLLFGCSVFSWLGKLNTHYSSPNYAAVYPGAIIKPCHKLPTPLTSTGGDESSTNWNSHWKVSPALAGVMNEPSEVIYWTPFEACSIMATCAPLWKRFQEG